jgi:hypothetical protein
VSAIFKEVGTELGLVTCLDAYLVRVSGRRPGRFAGCGGAQGS